jgi:hypothetical protein
MNERIQQLAEQATKNVESTNSYHNQVFDKELFAQLIVKECDLYARRNWEHGALLGGDLLNHFGVKR